MFKRGGGVWWTCIRLNGKKIQESLDTTDKKLAQAIESKIRTDIIEGKYFGKYAGSNKTFAEMMEKFMQEHAPKVSRNMQISYRTSLGNLTPYFNDARVLQITPKMISSYKAKRYGDGVKPASVNRELSMLSKAFNLACKEWEWVKENPVSKVSKDKENNERDRWLTDDEEKRLLENSPQWLKEIIIFDLNTGLRQNELLSLTWDRVDLFRRVIVIQESKNGKPRTIPLTQTALDILTEKSKVINLKTGLVFPNGKGKKIVYNVLTFPFNKAKARAGIENFHFHDLRHTFATRLAQRGVDIYKISKLLGHKDIRMTQRYAHHCPESLRIGIQVLESDYVLTTVRENRKVSNV
ncbi:MAG: site-specific integrase [Candidatus Brocadiales bacterium]|nr:site-specific integrase [Candidatus Brocadiales bacterium]